MTRTEWIGAFVTEMERLRPHLKPRTGRASNYVHALALQNYDPAVKPEEAARAVHERMGPPSHT